MVTKGKRIKQLRETINKEWTECYFKFILEHPMQNWEWEEISSNPNITWEIIKNNPMKPWNWSNISMNPNITWKIIKDNPIQNWTWWGITKNPNITMEIIRDNSKEEWDWLYISMNMFTKEKEQFLNRKYREYMAKYKIQQWCLSIIISPHYKIGRKMIDKKYKELFA